MKYYFAEYGFGQRATTVSRRTLRYFWIAILEDKLVPSVHTTKYGWCKEMDEAPKIDSSVGINPSSKKCFRVTQVLFYNAIKYNKET